MGAWSRVVGAGAAVISLSAWLASGCGGDTEGIIAPGGDGGDGGFVAGTGGVGGCMAASEICNGIDDDCDTQVDEDCSCLEGESQACWSGPPELEDVGTCIGGTQTCDINGQWGPCAGEVLPAAESCDGADDDCDGEIDEGFETVTCGLGICQTTVEECVEGVATPCIPGTPNPTELCDGADDDCDGMVDEGCSCVDGSSQPCYTGAPATKNVGACMDGTQSCANGQWGACTGDVTPTAESCDGLDNDCDASTDEGNPGGGAICATGVPGKCAAGTESCSGGQIVCQQIEQPSAETCNGIDDDCDGSADENDPGGGGTCNTGLLGKCAAGTFSCQAGMLVCIQNAQPSPEACNVIDDDCDGQTDEGNPGGGGSCTTNQLGVCAAGTQSCQSGALTCLANQMAGAETCNGLDDDCDGATDEANPGGGGACLTGLMGQCSAGTLQCQGAALTCVANNTPTSESCDGLDNDCDGTSDENNPGGGGSCSTGLLGICAPGTVACQGGGLTCVGNQGPTTEACDAVDNDCDGSNNEGNPGGGGSCSTGQAGVCAAGTLNCVGNSLACQANTSASAEVCDGLDNDCDNVVDDGNPGGGSSCNTGNLGICAAGTVTCSGGSLGCVQNQQPAAEQCSDALDNDCDGLVDTGDPSCPTTCSHALCTTGAALVSGCNQCVTDVCAADAYCCTTGWDGLCVEQVRTICGSLTCPESAGTCPHPLCQVGPASTPFTSGCDSAEANCAAAVCAEDAYCCANDWDTLCMNQVASVCGLNCSYQ